MKGSWANISTTLYGNWKRLDFLLVKTNVISPWVLFKLNWNSPPLSFYKVGQRERTWGTCGFAVWGRCGRLVGSALGMEVAGWLAPQSFLVRIWSYTLGMTHTVKPCSQKKLKENWRKLICIFYKPRSKNILPWFCLTRGLLKIHEPRPPWILGFSEGWDFSGCHFTTLTTTQNNNNKKKTGWRITYSTFAVVTLGWHCAKNFIVIIWLHSLLQWIIFILWMRTLRLREIKNLIQVLQSGKWLS